eukprot:tig00000241_g20987.t1
MGPLVGALHLSARAIDGTIPGSTPGECVLVDGELCSAHSDRRQAVVEAAKERLKQIELERKQLLALLEAEGVELQPDVDASPDCEAAKRPQQAEPCGTCAELQATVESLDRQIRSLERTNAKLEKERAHLQTTVEARGRERVNILATLKKAQSDRETWRKEKVELQDELRRALEESSAHKQRVRELEELCRVGPGEEASEGDGPACAVAAEACPEMERSIEPISEEQEGEEHDLSRPRKRERQDDAA